MALSLSDDPIEGQQTSVVLSIDAMGGDLGPAPVVDGIVRVLKDHPNIQFILHGQSDVLKPLVKKRGISKNCKIVHADDVVTMDDKPSQVMRHGKKTSMWSAIESVKSKEASVCVSLGNTGALMAVSMIKLRKLPGINRPAIAILWPSKSKSGYNIMLDVGADIRADENDLVQYGLMGTSYARNGLGLKRPRVGLLNVGTEEHKGRAELKVAHDLMQRHEAIGEFDFVGFVEGNDIPSDRVDVIVTDGFTGNVALKSAEGTAKLLRDGLKDSFSRSILSKLSGLMAYRPLRRVASQADPRNVNGGVFLGLNGTVVKSHGGADAKGVAAAVGLAYRLSLAGFGDRLAARVASATGYDTEIAEAGIEK